MQEVEVVAARPVAEWADGREIVADAGEEPGEQVEGRPDRQHEREQQQGQQQVGLAQALHALVHSRDHRHQRDGRDAGDQQHLGGVGRRHTEQMGEPRRSLLGAQTERRRQSEERGEHGEDVDDVAEPAPYRFAQHWVERRPQGQRQPEVVGGEGERDRDHREHGPGVHTPVEDGSGDGKALRGGGVRGFNAERRIPEVIERLRHPEEHQADADPGREQHGEP